MRKVMVTLVLVALFAVGLTAGFTTPTVEAARPYCWAYCSGDLAIQCCKVHGEVLCWFSGDCPF